MSPNSRDVPRGESVPLRLPRGRLVRIEGDPRDLSVVEPLRSSGGDWEPHVRAALERLVDPDWVCLDIGANIGVHTLNLATLARHVVAFEPSPLSFRYLRANVRSAGFADRTTLVEAAVLEDARSIEVVEAREFAGAAYVAPVGSALQGTRHPYLWEARDRVETDIHAVAAVRLDDWLAANDVVGIGLVKIDVEGAEESALAGAADLLARERPVLVTEYNPACAEALFGASRDSYFRFLAATYGTIETIEEDGGLLPVSGWDELDERLRAGPGWLDLVCRS